MIFYKGQIQESVKFQTKEEFMRESQKVPYKVIIFKRFVVF